MKTQITLLFAALLACSAAHAADRAARSAAPAKGTPGAASANRLLNDAAVGNAKLASADPVEKDPWMVPLFQNARPLKPRWQ